MMNLNTCSFKAMQIHLLLIIFTLFLNISSVQAHEAHTIQKDVSRSLAISVAVDANAVFWRVSVQNDHVLVDHSEDYGKTFSEPVVVNKAAMKVAAHHEARPKIAVAKNGHVYVSWTEPLKQHYAGNIWFSRSIDGGKSFEKPYIVHQNRDIITHRYAALNVAENGTITIAWLDKRDFEAAKKADRAYEGAAVYYAVSNNDGKQFEPEIKLADTSCECCRIASSNKPDGTAVLMWRHVFEGMQRDHMMAEIPKKGVLPELHRASFGRWKIDGCPHHGGALASGGIGNDWWGYHLAYFDGKEKKPGLYYTRMDGLAWARVPAKRFGDFNKQAGHPALWSGQQDGKEVVWRVWREVHQTQKHVLGQLSEDGGRSWGDVNTLATAEGKVDYPQLVGDENMVYLVWNTRATGLVIKALP